MYKQLADMAANKISAAITETHVGEELVKAILDPYNMEGSSIHVNFTTSNPRRYETSEHKCHVNYVIGDSDWELDMAEAWKTVLVCWLMSKIIRLALRCHISWARSRANTARFYRES